MDRSARKYEEFTSLFGQPEDFISRVFETSRGSLYFMNQEGQTVRHKSFHLGHGEHDQGWKELSICTLYLRNEDAERIAPLIHGCYWLVYREAYGDECYLIDDRPMWVEKLWFQRKPEIGLCPVEFFNWSEINDRILYPRKIHIGNTITSFHL